MFCPNCGNPLNKNARFCVSCGAEQRWEDSIPPPTLAVNVFNRPKPYRSLKDRIMDFIIILVGVILFLMGVGYMGLSVVGREATAQVTEYEQVLFINNDDSTRNPSRYKLKYSFSIDGEQYTGSVTRVFPNGSHIRTTIPVRYLPFWPHVNAEDGKTVGITGPIMIGVSVVVLVFGVKKKSRLKNYRR